ncbi:MAG: gamma-glutamyl-gamma-aminobutyrate hydrolase family protein [Planctomycetes bacterium]|nr:gamma-glutamyl-gamma-aminobutyrate hydrolase family protein [Planctomycetota bacterium]MBM4058765.1 gamma-glutamyl-gamma-aminobutyrate hydrolase family protein [Planctomycetota bacterium]
MDNAPEDRPGGVRRTSMAAKPLIGINTDYRATRQEHAALSVVAAGYFDGISASGGIPVILPPLADEDDVVRLLDLLDGVVMVGGADLDPRRDGYMPHPAVRPMDAPRCAFQPAFTPDRDARRGAACDPHRPIVKHLANHPRPDGYTRQVGATPNRPRITEAPSISPRSRSSLNTSNLRGRKCCSWWSRVPRGGRSHDGPQRPSRDRLPARVSHGWRTIGSPRGTHPSWTFPPTPAEPARFRLTIPLPPPFPRPAAAGFAVPTSACPSDPGSWTWPALTSRSRPDSGRTLPAPPRCRRPTPPRSRPWPTTSSGGSGSSTPKRSGLAARRSAGSLWRSPTCGSVTRTRTRGRWISSSSTS